MAQTKASREGTPRMKKLVMNISADLLKTLKFRAVEEETTVTEIVTRAIQRELGKGGGKSGKK
jgi:hypothetical protein